MNNNYGPPPGFSPPPYGYGPPPGAPPPPNPMNPMGPMGPMGPPPQGNNGLAVASLVTGIVGLFPGCCCAVLGIPLSVAAVVMGLVAMSQITKSQGLQRGRGMAIAGTVLGGVAIAANIVNVAFSFSNELMHSMHV